MRFVNKGEPVQVRIKEKTGYRWEGVKTNQTINLSEKIGLVNGFKKVNSNETVKTTEGKIGKKKVETKQIEEVKYTNDSDFYKELLKIKGIGKYTAQDIVDFATKEKLIEVVKLKGALPFRNDIEKILRKKYG